MTRREAVLDALKGADGRGGRWVNGTELANAETGGSEGLKRLRELRADGWPIEMRPHPDETRTVRQYRLRADVPWPGEPTPPALREQSTIWDDLPVAGETRR